MSVKPLFKFRVCRISLPRWYREKARRQMKHNLANLVTNKSITTEMSIHLKY